MTRCNVLVFTSLTCGSGTACLPLISACGAAFIARHVDAGAIETEEHIGWCVDAAVNTVDTIGEALCEDVASDWTDSHRLTQNSKGKKSEGGSGEHIGGKFWRPTS